MSTVDPLAAKPGIRLSDDQRIAWLQLIRSENVGPSTFRDLINHFGTAAAALEALPDLAARANSKKRIRIAVRSEAEQELQRLTQTGGTTVCLGEADYPPALRTADGAPPVLSVRGDTQILTRHSVAFVGSRNSSLAGVKLTKQLAGQTADAGYAIISGLARGIDSAAHQASLSQGTVAVFAGGVDHIYPHENTRLSDEIISNGGALVSEMPFGWKPRAQDFPRRNRIVAGIALGLVVVEAAKRSGSLISARLANEMGRLVFAVPGSPLDPRSEGANHLIKQGAQLITSADDILRAIEPLANEPLQSSYTLDEGSNKMELDSDPSQTDREKLLSALGHTPTDIDELLRFTEITPGSLHMLILELDLAGIVERHSGNRVSLAG